MPQNGGKELLFVQMNYTQFKIVVVIYLFIANNRGMVKHHKSAHAALWICKRTLYFLYRCIYIYLSEHEGELQPQPVCLDQEGLVDVIAQLSRTPAGLDPILKRAVPWGLPFTMLVNIQPLKKHLTNNFGLTDHKSYENIFKWQKKHHNSTMEAPCRIARLNKICHLALMGA